MTIEDFALQIWCKREIRPHPKNSKQVIIPERGLYRFFVEDILKRNVEPVNEGTFLARLDEQDIQALELFSITYEVVLELK